MTDKVKDFRTCYKAFSNISYITSEGKRHLVVLAGGMSGEREISIITGQAVVKAAVANGYQVTLVDHGIDIGEVLMKIKPDVVFNALHGTFGEDGCIPGLLNAMRIPYTHSGVLASSICFNKVKSYELFEYFDIKCPTFKVVHDVRHKGNKHTIIDGMDVVAVNSKAMRDKISNDPIHRPYIIKPVSQGSSIGVHAILDEDNFDFAIYDFPYGSPIIVQPYTKGREIEVAVLNDKALGALEIKFDRLFWDYEAKYTPGIAEHIMPARLSKQNYEKVLMLAEKAYTSMGCNGPARVEFIYVDSKDDFYILEINTHPGMTPASSYQEIAAYAGISFNDLIEQIINSARYES